MSSDEVKKELEKEMIENLSMSVQQLFVDAGFHGRDMVRFLFLMSTKLCMDIAPSPSLGKAELLDLFVHQMHNFVTDEELNDGEEDI